MLFVRNFVWNVLLELGYILSKGIVLVGADMLLRETLLSVDALVQDVNLVINVYL